MDVTQDIPLTITARIAGFAQLHFRGVSETGRIKLETKTTARRLGRSYFYCDRCGYSALWH